MNVLLVLTMEWPYGTRESFVGNEIEYAKGFDKVYVMPLDASDTLRTVPESVVVVRSPKNGTPKYLYLKSLFVKEFWPEVRKILSCKNAARENLLLLIRYTGRTIKRKKLLEKWIKNNLKSTDTITVYSYWMASDAVASCMIRKKDKRINRIVTRCHSFELYEYRSSFNYIPYRSFIFRNADMIMPISKNGSDYLIDTYDYLDADKIHVARLGTNDWGINPPCDILDEGRLSIVSCSSLIGIKRVDLMIQALSKIKSPVIWRHFGDGELLAELESLCKDLPPHVSFLFMGNVDNRELMQWYLDNHVDLFVNTSKYEGIPVSIMEALSFGIPVIATDVGGTAEIVEDRNNGFLLNEDFDVSELSGLIDQYYLLEADKKVVMREKARSFWKENYDAAVNYESFYNSISGK